MVEATRLNRMPTLSAAIRKLEDDLNTTLIVRGHRFMGLTPEGEKALVWGRQILTDFDSLRKDLTGPRKGLTGTSSRRYSGGEQLPKPIRETAWKTQMRMRSPGFRGIKEGATTTQS